MKCIYLNLCFKWRAIIDYCNVLGLLISQFCRFSRTIFGAIQVLKIISSEILSFSPKSKNKCIERFSKIMNLQNRDFAVKLKFLVNCFIKVCCIIQKIDILTLSLQIQKMIKRENILWRDLPLTVKIKSTNFIFWVWIAKINSLKFFKF